jgi:hypothetical protein
MAADRLQVNCSQKVVLELSRRIESDAEITACLAPRALSSALDDVRGDRHRCADHLSPERAVIRPSNPAGDAMSIERHRLCLLPDLQILEIAHPVMMSAGGAEFSAGRMQRAAFHCTAIP